MLRYRLDRVLLILALILGAGLRLSRLMSLFPVLVDEAIYLRWAEIIAHTHTWFISLLDGKPPLSFWIYAAMRIPFGTNPLLGDRLASFAAGLLCVWVLYRIGADCGGPRAGAIAALLYSVLPYGVLYDHIGYTDSLVNLAGALLVCMSLRTFGAGQLTWHRTLILGFTLGLGIFVKTTVLLLAFAPIAIGAYIWKGGGRMLAAHLIAIYAVAAVFPAVCHFAIPPGPGFDYNSVLFHHTTFYTPLMILLTDPLRNLRVNAPLLLGYAAHYVTYPALIAAAASAVFLWNRNRLVVLILLACILPFLLAMTALEYFPSRYAFPSVWPLLLTIACSAAAAGERRLPPVIIAELAIVLGTLTIQSARILTTPERALHEIDAQEFLGPGPYSGAGVIEAIARLKAEARGGPITILTDPWWGPPSDVVSAYLNRVDGILVYEAWWLQKKEYPLVPNGAMPVWRSQYQRIPAGEVDFSALPRLFYITDTNYHSPRQVREMSSAAQLIARFPKRGGRQFVDVYQIR